MRGYTATHGVCGGGDKYRHQPVDVYNDNYEAGEQGSEDDLDEWMDADTEDYGDDNLADLNEPDYLNEHFDDNLADLLNEPDYLEDLNEPDYLNEHFDDNLADLLNEPDYLEDLNEPDYLNEHFDDNLADLLEPEHFDDDYELEWDV